MIKRNRHEYHLLDLCGRVAGAYTGSGDGIESQEAEAIGEWLDWRLTDGWVPHSIASSFDKAVLQLCREAREMLRDIVNNGNRP